MKTTNNNSAPEKSANKLISVDYAENMVRRYQSENMTNEDFEEKLYTLVDTLLDQPSVKGSENAFHNFALNFSRIEDSETACEIVEKGVELFPNNTDLLADYLQMGSDCGQFDQCEQYYQRLIQIGYETWTWRAFSFSIDYLLLKYKSLADAEDKDIIQTALAITDKSREYIDSEESYCSEADIYNAINNSAKMIDALRAGIANCRRSPKCSLRYADYLIENGEYEEANKIVQKMLSMVSSQESINTAYVYYISGLCKYAIALQNEDFSPETAESIFGDFVIARDLDLGKEAYVKNMKKCIIVFERRSGVEYPRDLYPDDTQRISIN